MWGEMRNGLVQVRQAGMNLKVRVAAALLAVTVAGCSGFGGPKKDDVTAADPNTYPANYRTQIADFLRQSLTSRADYRGALISQPTLKTVGDNQRYVVCLQFNGNSQIKNKVAIYFAGMISQFIDSTPEQCSDAAYQPFKELGGAPPA
jgi:hypothetical protein